MGSFIELNDTLQITSEQGFPVELVLEKHKQKPFVADDFKNRVFEFRNKKGARIYHQSPTRCFLVHNINGKWIYWGKVLIIEQTIQGENRENQVTSGKYKITCIYPPDYQEQITKHECPEGLSCF